MGPKLITSVTLILMNLHTHAVESQEISTPQIDDLKQCAEQPLRQENSITESDESQGNDAYPPFIDSPFDLSKLVL